MRKFSLIALALAPFLASAITATKEYVDRKDGEIRGLQHTLVTDLPGLYSLSPYTSEEEVSRDFILNNHPQAIINILDATNIERKIDGPSAPDLTIRELDQQLIIYLSNTAISNNYKEGYSELDPEIPEMRPDPLCSPAPKPLRP